MSYKAHFDKGDYLIPLPEWQFSISESHRERLVEGINLANSQNEILPSSIRESYSIRDSFTEQFKIDPALEKEILIDLKALGYQCERNDDLIWNSCNIFG